MAQKSSCSPLPVPILRHLAIVMDGNGRWARKRFLPAIAGHKAGSETLKRICEACANREIEYLTVYAFSTENWKRPAPWIQELMDLLSSYLQHEVEDLIQNGIELRIIGNLEGFSPDLREKIVKVCQKTPVVTRLKLIVALNYGARWEMVQAVKKLVSAPGSETITESSIEGMLSTAGIPDPDLFIRTSGEQRLSNFLLWQLAYTELYFTETLWPDFGEEDLDSAISYYHTKDRRYGDVAS